MQALLTWHDNGFNAVPPLHVFAYIKQTSTRLPNKPNKQSSKYIREREREKSKMSGAGKVVCVTGASGYVASWLVKLLLERGYTVRASVRNLSDPRRVDHLKALEGAAERLELYAADLLQEGSFDSVIDGCEGVFHTASPAVVSVTDPQAQLIEPAVNGTLNVLKSSVKAKSVRRVIVTSSVTAALYNTNPRGPDVVADETWFSDPAFCEQYKDYYSMSKTLAESAARKYAEEHGLDLVVVIPGFVIGPLLQPTLNLSSELIVNIINGEEAMFPHYQFIDVRDAVLAHVLALENPSAERRYLVVAETVGDTETREILHKHYPSIPPPTKSRESPSCTISKKKAESLGIKFISVEESLKDTVESLKEKKFVSL